MKSLLAAALSAALLLAGCATQTREQLAAVRASGVSPALVHKLQRWGCLSPADIIELTHHHVNDAVALRQLDRTGVDYVVDKSILKQLRKAGVSETVVSAVILAGKRFVSQYRNVHYWVGGSYGQWGYPYYPYDPFYYDLGWPYPRADFGPGLGGPGPGGPGPGGPGGGGPGGGFGGPGGGGPGGGPGGPGGGGPGGGFGGPGGGGPGGGFGGPGGGGPGGRR